MFEEQVLRSAGRPAREIGVEDRILRELERIVASSGRRPSRARDLALLAGRISLEFRAADRMRSVRARLPRQSPRGTPGEDFVDRRRRCLGQHVAHLHSPVAHERFSKGIAIEGRVEREKFARHAVPRITLAMKRSALGISPGGNKHRRERRMAPDVDE